jgi:hypothetical protein
MPWVGFEPKFPAFERAKTVHALDRAATVIDIWKLHNAFYTTDVQTFSVIQFSSWGALYSGTQ